MRIKIESHCTNNSTGEYCLRVASVPLTEDLPGMECSVLLGPDAHNYLEDLVMNGVRLHCHVIPSEPLRP